MPLINSEVPFITRGMLEFQLGAVFKLVVKSQASDNISVQIRGATKEGLFVFQHIPASDRTVSTVKFNIPDIPLWVSITDNTGSYEPGACFMQVGLEINGDTVHQLASGYIYKTKSITWPAANLQSSLPSEGFQRMVTTSDPAAGAEITTTVPANTIWKIKGLQYDLVTDANAATRRSQVGFGNADFNIIECVSNTSQIASLTRNYRCSNMPAGALLALVPLIIIPIPPDIILKQGDRIFTTTTSLQATDNYSSMKIWVEEWMSPLVI